MSAIPPHVLVVGGSGILAPAVRDVLDRGWTASVVSRSAGRVAAADARARAAVADVTVPGALRSALGDARFDLALVYQPFAPAEAWRAVADRVAGTLVALLVSAHAAPRGAPAPPLPEGVDGTALVRHLVLGWHAADSGRARWHTPEEISKAVLDVADHGRSAVLGTVRPWAARPAH
ncbi:hypothetical protein [Nonomuraea sp. B5E05]|uniref:hypothetical protein n=1 Tax=Nonomuraea sp. B5E05 TaxID=3153569 RepID=UPI0032611D68